MGASDAEFEGSCGDGGAAGVVGVGGEWGEGVGESDTEKDALGESFVELGVWSFWGKREISGDISFTVTTCWSPSWQESK